MTASRPQPRRPTNTGVLILLLGAVTLIWVLYGVAIIYYPFPGDFWDARGKFGDMFGALTALFNACAFAALIYGIRLEYKAFRRQELHSALSAQLDSLIQLYTLADRQRTAAWRAIATAPGGPGEDYTLEKAIALQVTFLDRLMAGEDIKAVPNYGRPPRQEAAE